MLEHRSDSLAAARLPALSRRALLGWGAGAALGAIAGPLRASEGPQARPAITVLDRDWIDITRSRAVPVRLYLPEQARGPVPLLVVSHGIGGTRNGYSYLGRHMAEAGIASLHLQHIGSDREIWRGNPLTLVFRLQAAAQETEALARVQDLRFALDRLTADAELGPRIDLRRIAGAGHSYGANTMMLAGGARVLRDGQPLALREERLRGVLLLSSPPFYGEPDLGAILRPVQLPSLHITTTEDIITIPGYNSPASDRVAVYEAMGSARKALAVFQGGPHNVFTDRTTASGGELNARIKQATKELALDFVQDLFSHGGPTEGALAPWRSRHAGLIARFDLRSATAAA
jgi:dienelactone hydrolase